MTMMYRRRTLRSACAILLATGIPGSAIGQSRAVGFIKGMPYSQGYIIGDTLYISGQPGASGQNTAPAADITVQTTRAIGGLRAVVEQAGFRMSDIVSTTVYVTDLKDVDGMNKVYNRLVPDPKPSRITIQVAGLIGDPRVEISAIAVRH